MKWPFRVAAALLLLFCAGHTAGGMLAQQSLGPESDVVFASMKSVHFTLNGNDSTWYGFWFGFGLMVSVFLVLSAIIALQLARVSREQWAAVAPIAWGLVAAQIVTAVLSFRYFFLAPGLIASGAAVLIAYGSVRKQRA